MIRICPNPTPWHEVHRCLTHYAETHKCTPPLPPKSLILSGWASTNDVEKKDRWAKTVRWAADNGCLELADNIPDSDFYFVDEPTTYTVGPMGGPMYRLWDFEEKSRPSSEELIKLMEILAAQWPQIVGKELSGITHPLDFTGKKARRLLVRADNNTLPPWGDWVNRSTVESERRTFTHFRAAVNKAISPHEVDHIDFIDEQLDQSSIL